MPKIQKSASDSNRTRRIDARSCLACHRRKVRCDRRVPCTNCARAGCSCVYPSRTSDERRIPSLQHIADRLERVESILSHLCENRVPSFAATGDSAGPGRQDASSHQHQHQHQFSSAQRSPMSWELLLNDGQMVQYVNNSNIKDLLQDEERMKMTPLSGHERESSQLPPASTPMMAAQPAPQADTSSGLLELYPDPQLALRLWSVYVKSVDPVLKILHIPTTQSAVIATIVDPQSAGSSMVALTFAIYFAAITALGHYDEPGMSVEERSVFLKRYKSALDRLLIATDVMNRPEMTALQALAIYVTCLRAHETGRSVWVLNGLAIRLAQSMGLHRDGADLQLSPFDTELRLRLWWHLCVLDSRAPEDQGFELTLDALNHGLRLPLNIDDHQIFPTMTELPAETTGWTEMSFFLIQTESCQLIQPVLGTREPFSTTSLPDLTAKRNMIHDRSQYVVRKYGLEASCKSHGGDHGGHNTLPRVAMQHFTTARKKMEFMLQLREEISTQAAKTQSQSQPHSTDPETMPTTTDTFRPSFRLACESMESNSRLLNSAFSAGFRWLFTTYTPWYALAYVLRCLCSCPRGGGGEAERAWALVDAVFPVEMSLDAEGPSSCAGPGRTRQNQGQGQGQGQGSIWKCLALLRSQALSLRRARSGSQSQSQSQSRPSSITGDGGDNFNNNEMHPHPQLQPHLQPQLQSRIVENPLYARNNLAAHPAPSAVLSSSPPHPTHPSHSTNPLPPPPYSTHSLPPPPPDLDPLHDEQTFLADTSTHPNFFSGVDFSMSEIPFLPEWNAVMNGCLVGGEGEGGEIW